jgi:hypothetical protein
MIEPEITIDLSLFYKAFGEPKRDATTILRRILSSWGVKYEVVELKVPPGPYPDTISIKKEVSKRKRKRAVVVVRLHDGHQTATALVFEPFTRVEGNG